MKLALLLLLVLVATHNGSAQRETPFTVYGAGTDVSCGAFISSTGANRRALENWILGFVSGAGYARSLADSTTRETDGEGILRAADKHCVDKPLDKLTQAAFSVVSQLIR